MNRQGAIKTGALLSKLARPQNTLYPALLAAGMALIGDSAWQRAVASLISVGALYGLAAGYNNFQDLSTDKINRRLDNPLTRAIISPAGLYVFWALNATLLVAPQFVMAQPVSVLIVTGFLCIALAYSHPLINLKSKGWLSTVSLAICYGGLPTVLGAVQGNLRWSSILFLALLQVPLLTPSLLAKDYKDEKGDRATGKHTPLVRHGPQVVRIVSACFAGVAAVLYFTASPGVVAALLLGSYLLFIYYLHRQKGRIPALPSKLGSALLLTISLTTTAHLT
jgi:4-hydroxybenzoate polyprenyltransferase